MLLRRRFNLYTRLYEIRRLLIVILLIAAIWGLNQAGLTYRYQGGLALTEAPWAGLLLRYGLTLLAGSLLLSWLRPQADQLLLPWLGLIGGIGLATLYRLPTPSYWDSVSGRLVYATGNMAYVERQATFLMMGIGLAVLIAVTPRLLAWLRDHRFVAIMLGLGLLAAAALFGREAAAGGPRVSLNLGLFQFQPSELIKLLFVIYLASYLRVIQPHLKRLTYTPLRILPVPHMNQLLPILLILGSGLTFLVLMSDLGSALLLIILLPLLLYAAVPRHVFWYMAITVLFSAYLLWSGLNWLPLNSEQTNQPLATITNLLPDRVSDGWLRVEERVANYQDPWGSCTEVNNCASYQTLHALYAVAAGGLTGSGPGQGMPGQAIIPFVHTDMVYALLVEEWGLLGAGALLLLYWLFIRRGLTIAQRQTDPFSHLLAVGIVAIFALQLFIIIGGTINLIPLTGITVPFLSYGGSSVIVNSLMVGLLLSLSAQTDGQHLSYATHERLLQMHRFLALGFVLLLVGTAYWSLWKGPQLSVAFAEPSPLNDNLVARQREAAWLNRVERGRILAADGTVLVNNRDNGRYYHLPSAVHILGQVDGLGRGLSGLEAAYNDALLGRGRYDWPTIWAQQTAGHWQGNDLQTTIDPRWQQAAHTHLGHHQGAVVVLDAQTGAVLAMVSHPLYDPGVINSPAAIDELNRSAATPFLNRATEGLFPPGSTFKTVTGAAALTTGIAEPTTVYNFSQDIWYWEGNRTCHRQWVGGAVISSCNSERRQMSFSEGFADSDNVLFAQLAVELGRETFWEQTAAFGFGQTIPFDLPVTPSQLAGDPLWLDEPGQLAMSGFGQARVQATPLQMALVAAAVANEGQLPTPYLVERIIDPTERPLHQTKPQPWQRALSQPVAQQMAEVMVESVEIGWASSAAVEGLVVGGKTGTAEWSGTPQGRPPHAWFIGFAEMPDGQLVAIAVLAEMAGEGSLVAAPIAGAILAEMQN